MTVFGISLLRVAPRLWTAVTQEAERLGFESVWMSEHLVLPAQFDVSRYPDGRLPIDPRTPVFDPLVYLAALAATTTTLRLGTYIYQLALRPVLVAARAVTTLDVVSEGRLELGVGAGWLREEWDAAGVPFAGRGARLEAAVRTCRRLWSVPLVEARDEYFDFPPVAFEPKPVQAPLPVHMGGESPVAMRRALELAQGWIGMHHSPATAVPVLDRLRRMEDSDGQIRPPLITTVAAHPGPEIDVVAWQRTGVDRVIVAPWTRSSEAIEAMQRFAAAHLT